METPVQVTPDQQAPILDAANLATNATTKFVPTTEGMVCAYLSLMIMALVPIFFGSFKSIRHQTDTKTKCRETGEQAETMTVKDAAVFPLIASCALFGFYILIKVSPELVNLIVSVYFLMLGVFAIYRLIKPVTHKIFPTRFNSIQYTLLFGSTKLDSSGQQAARGSNNEDTSGTSSPSVSNDNFDDSFAPSEVILGAKFTPSDVLAFVLSTLFGLWYIYTKHWVANNAFGLAFALNGIELLPVNSVQIGCILLGGLFFYDVFWVFGTDVMVSVARKFDAPIKIIFPQDFLISGFMGKNFAMLGLGDIVIPGIFIAFLLRFDHSLKRKTNTYFWSCFIAYILGLGLTIGVMSYFKHAQPALLYLVPCCIIIPAIVALVKGDMKPLLKYRDHPENEEEPSSPSDEDNTEEDDESHTDDDDDDQETPEKSTRKISTRASSKKNK